MISKKIITDEWTSNLMSIEDVKEILNQFKLLKDQEKIIVLTEVNKFINAFVSFLLNEEPIGKARIRQISKNVFKYSDLLQLALDRLTPKILEATNDVSKWKLLWFLQFTPNPLSHACSFFDGKLLVPSKEQRLKAIENAWLQFIGLKFTSKMLRSFLPHLVEELMDVFPNCELFSDFLYKVFHQGHYLAVLSLGGIFKLIVRQNFEHPDFYSDVYQMISPNVCYSDYARKFFDLVDIILSSTHVPIYVIVAFIKKLSRTLLYAPINCQLPLLHLIKNLLCRHSVVHSILVDREEPQTLESDPYNEGEKDLNRCGANESSLWELKAIQSHWHYKVAEKANFVDHCSQDHEVPLRWESADEIFDALYRKSEIKSKPDGASGPSNEQKADDGTVESDDGGANPFAGEDHEDSGPPQKRTKFGGRNSKEKIAGVPLNEAEPSAEPNLSKLWCF